MGSLFKNVEVLFEVNKKLLALLEIEEQKEPHLQQFGRVFLDMVRACVCLCAVLDAHSLTHHRPYACACRVYSQMDELKKYNSYSANNEQAGDTVNKLTKANPSFAALAEEVKRLEECKKLDLAAYIIKPFQRICRYPLLLRVRASTLPPHTHTHTAHSSRLTPRGSYRNCARPRPPTGRTTPPCSKL